MKSLKVVEKDDLFSSVLISVNGCVAGSIFGVPWGYLQSGWLFSTCLAVLGFVIMMGLGFIVLQVLSRMPKIHALTSKGYKISHVPITDLFQTLPPEHYITVENRLSDENSSLLASEDPKDSNIKYDFTMICKTLLGKTMEKILNALLVFNSLVFLMGCTSTFATSMAGMVPVWSYKACDLYESPEFSSPCRYQYIFYILVFAVIVVCMTLVWHFSESRVYLETVCIARICVILIMSVTSLVAAISQTELDSDQEVDYQPVMVNLSGFGISVPIIYLTMGFHVLIPDILQPLQDKEKNSKKMIWYGFFISFCLIVLLGLTTIFGTEDVNRLSTLNWQNYSNGRGQDDKAWWTYGIVAIVSIFPAFDVTSIFSITAVNTVDNIIALKYQGLKDFTVDLTWIFWTRVVILTITLVVPMYFYDLGIIFALAGAINMLFILLFVVMFGIASVILIPQRCMFDNFLANLIVLRFLLGFSILFSLGMWASFLFHLLS